MSLTQVTKAGLHDIALDHVFTIGASGTDHYTFQGEGLNGTVNDPTLYLTRGKTYRFENGTGAHPIRIQSTSGASGTAYNTGVTNNAGSGTVIVEVQHDAPDVLYYQCTSHANMNGVLYITGALADGGVTTAKLAADAVDGTKIADNAVAAEHIAANAVGSSELADNAVDTAAIADDAVTAAKIADGTITSTQIANDAVTRSRIQDEAVDADRLAASAVTTAKIADQAVTLAKLPHGDGSSDGKFLRANNGADPTFETVNTNLVADTSPQLGGDLDTNSHNILLDDAHAAKFGDANDLLIKHSGTNSEIYHNGEGNLYIAAQGSGEHLILQGASDVRLSNSVSGDMYLKGISDGAVELYHDNVKRIETTSTGTNTFGSVEEDGRTDWYIYTGSAGLSDGASVDIVTNAGGYLWGYFDLWCVSYHGSIGRAHWTGSSSQYSNDDNYVGISNNMGYCNLERFSSGSNNGIKITRTGSYGTVNYHWTVLCRHANAQTIWNAGTANTTRRAKL